MTIVMDRVGSDYGSTYSHGGIIMVQQSEGGSLMLVAGDLNGE